MDKYYIGVDTATSKGAMVVSKHTDNGVEIINVYSYNSKFWSLARFRFKIGMIYWKYFRGNTTFIIEKKISETK